MKPAQSLAEALAEDYCSPQGGGEGVGIGGMCCDDRPSETASLLECASASEYFIVITTPVWCKSLQRHIRSYNGFGTGGEREKKLFHIYIYINIFVCRST